MLPAPLPSNTNMGGQYSKHGLSYVKPTCLTGFSLENTGIQMFPEAIWGFGPRDQALKGRIQGTGQVEAVLEVKQETLVLCKQ